MRVNRTMLSATRSDSKAHISVATLYSMSHQNFPDCFMYKCLYHHKYGCIKSAITTLEFFCVRTIVFTKFPNKFSSTLSNQNTPLGMAKPNGSCKRAITIFFILWQSPLHHQRLKLLTQFVELFNWVVYTVSYLFFRYRTERLHSTIGCNCFVRLWFCFIILWHT